MPRDDADRWERFLFPVIIIAQAKEKIASSGGYSLLGGENERKSQEMRGSTEKIRRKPTHFFKFRHAERLESSIREGILKSPATELAQALGMEIELVSATLKNKYLQSPFGVYPMKFFLAREHHPQQEVSQVMARASS